MKFCQFCGQSLEQEAKFCVSCGKRVLPYEKEELDALQSNPAPAQPLHNQVFVQSVTSSAQPVIQQNYGTQPKASDASSLGYSILCFFFPLVGLILYLVFKDDYPLRAKSCGKGAIIGVSISVGIGILVSIIMMITVAAFNHSYYWACLNSIIGMAI